MTEVERADNTLPAAYIHDHIPPLVSLPPFPFQQHRGGTVRAKNPTDSSISYRSCQKSFLHIFKNLTNYCQNLFVHFNDSA